MDVDDLLGPASLPDVTVGADEALARTLARGRARRRRRRATAAAAAVVLVAGLGGAAAALTDHDASGRVDTAPTTATTGGTATTGRPSTAPLAPEPEPGRPATWRVDPADPPSADASTFTALVTGLECSGGVTGRVLRPGILVTETSVIVTFTVERLDPGADGSIAYTCQGNPEVAYEVDLGQPLVDRTLYDGACPPRAEPLPDQYCLPEQAGNGDPERAVRWPLSGPAAGKG